MDAKPELLGRIQACVDAANSGNISEILRLDPSWAYMLQVGGAGAPPVDISPLKGLDANTLYEALAEYIANRAPMVIHVHAKTIPILIEDGHYRSSFETNSTHGSASDATKSGYMNARYAWESACFLKLYDKTTNFERPKYGALNFLNMCGGVPSAISYGSCYMVLSNELRKRITISTGDTSGSRCIGVLDFCNHVLLALSYVELIEAIKIAIGVIESSSHYCGGYREIQIHGEMLLSRDIAELHADETLSDDLIAQWIETFKVPVVKFARKPTQVAVVGAAPAAAAATPAKKKKNPTRVRRAPDDGKK
jgi:hypothetical protein